MSSFYRWFFMLLGTGVFTLDQWSKHFFRDPTLWTAPTAQQIPQSIIVNDYLWFTYVQNKGALAGMFSGFTPVLGLISLSVSLGIVIYGWKLPKDTHPLTYWAIGFLLGGAAGNMWDRLAHGFVVDFLDLRWQGQNVWPIFNVADIAVDIAIVLFILRGIVSFVSEHTATHITDVHSEV